MKCVKNGTKSLDSVVAYKKQSSRIPKTLNKNALIVTLFNILSH